MAKSFFILDNGDEISFNYHTFPSIKKGLEKSKEEKWYESGDTFDVYEVKFVEKYKVIEEVNYEKLKV